MASILSHPAVAIAVAPFFRRWGISPGVLWLGAFCTILPDFDVIGRAFGAPHADVFGHRGITHSLLFAAVTGLAAALLLRLKPRAVCVAFVFLCTASHGMLDAMTNGGEGIAFLAPFDAERYFFPWRPIQVSPIGVKRFLSERGVRVLASELVWIWLPTATVWITATCLSRRSSTSRSRR